MKKKLLITYGLVCVFLAGCAKAPSIPHKHVSRPPAPAGSYKAEGLASWYGGKFHGRRTASGEKFNKHDMTCAHRTLPFGTLLKVTNLDNDKETIVRVNDRGPAIRSRIIDLSQGAAKELEMIGTGTAKVRLISMDAEHPDDVGAIPTPVVHEVKDKPKQEAVHPVLDKPASSKEEIDYE